MTLEDKDLDEIAAGVAETGAGTGPTHPVPRRRRRQEGGERPGDGVTAGERA